MKKKEDNGEVINKPSCTAFIPFFPQLSDATHRQGKDTGALSERQRRANKNKTFYEIYYKFIYIYFFFLRFIIITSQVYVT